MNWGQCPHNYLYLPLPLPGFHVPVASYLSPHLVVVGVVVRVDQGLPQPTKRPTPNYRHRAIRTQQPTPTPTP